MFWENSCASGTAAVGMIFAARAGKTAELSLREPGGVLTAVVSETGEVRLTGTVRYLRQSEADIETA